MITVIYSYVFLRNSHLRRTQKQATCPVAIGFSLDLNKSLCLAGVSHKIIAIFCLYLPTDTFFFHSSQRYQYECIHQLTNVYNIHL